MRAVEEESPESLPVRNRKSAFAMAETMARRDLSLTARTLLRNPGVRFELRIQVERRRRRRQGMVKQANTPERRLDREEELRIFATFEDMATIGADEETRAVARVRLQPLMVRLADGRMSREGRIAVRNELERRTRHLAAELRRVRGEPTLEQIGAAFEMALEDGLTILPEDPDSQM